jgi:3-oxoadipate enol-lactonase
MHDGKVPTVRVGEAEVRAPGRDEALFAVGDAFARGTELREEHLEPFGRDRREERLFVLEMAIGRVVADPREAGDLAQGDPARVPTLRDHGKHGIEQGAPEIAVVIRAFARGRDGTLHTAMLTDGNIERKVCGHMTTSKERTIATNVGSLHVEERGRGPAVLCWPSLYADARSLDTVATALAPTHRVLVVDGPGHGKSEAVTRPYSIDDCADAGMEILDALGEKRATWIGSAWGGHVGVAAALRHAHRLDGLVILNSPMTPWRGKRRALMRLSQALLTIFGPRSFVASIIANKTFAPSAPNRDALVLGARLAIERCDPQGLRAAMRSAMFERQDLVPRLPDVKTPTVFFAGTEDGIFPLDEARAQAALIPGCRFVAVERSAHQSAAERPDVVLPILEEALATWTTPTEREAPAQNFT